MRNLIIGLDKGSPFKRNELTEFFSGKNWAYWHWMDDFWIVQVPDNYSPKVLHSELEESTEIGKPTMLVMEFQGKIKFWGRNDKEAWEWLDHIGNAG